MGNCNIDLVYFINSQGRKTVLSQSRNCWEIRGRSGFTALEVDIFSEKTANGTVQYFGKTAKPRNCSLNLVCIGKSSAERDRLFFEMLEVLLDTDGNGEGRLYVRRADGAIAYLNCVYSGGMEVTEMYRKFHKFTVSFFAADPWFYIVQKKMIFNDILNQTGHSLVFNNRTHNKMCAEFLVGSFDFTPEQFWSASGYIRNDTTGQKITFANQQYPSGVMVDNEYQLIMKFDIDATKIYLETISGEKKDGTSLFDWDNTDKDFLVAPGENVIDFGNLVGSPRFWYASYFTILERVGGV